MNDAAPNLTAIRGGEGKPGWAPRWAPSPGTLDYLANLATFVFLVLVFAYFLGVRSLKPFAKAAV